MPLTETLAWQMVTNAINDQRYTTDNKTGIDGFQMWIRGTNLNRYRKDFKRLYGVSPNQNGRDWQKYADEFIHQERIFKYKVPDTGASSTVFFVLPEHDEEFEAQYPEFKRVRL
jgi:hypothetical protein